MTSIKTNAAARSPIWQATLTLKGNEDQGPYKCVEIRARTIHGAIHVLEHSGRLQAEQVVTIRFSPNSPKKQPPCTARDTTL